MKNSAAKREGSSADTPEVSRKSESAAERPNFSYAKELRALGQALEPRRFSSFDLELESGIYVVRGTVIAPQGMERSLSRFIRDLISGSASRPNPTKAAGKIDVRYTPGEIEKLEVTGRARRAQGDRMPDPYSLSQILRGAGSYVDNRATTYLVGVAIEDRWVTVRYATADGRLEEAKQDLEYFYDYWVKMYLRRSNRPSLPPPHNPSLIATWEGIEKRDPTF